MQIGSISSSPTTPVAASSISIPPPKKAFKIEDLRLRIEDFFKKQDLHQLRVFIGSGRRGKS
jgi:hypothetical protein